MWFRTVLPGRRSASPDGLAEQQGAAPRRRPGLVAPAELSTGLAVVLTLFGVVGYVNASPLGSIDEDADLLYLDHFEGGVDAATAALALAVVNAALDDTPDIPAAHLRGRVSWLRAIPLPGLPPTEGHPRGARSVAASGTPGDAHTPMDAGRAGANTPLGAGRLDPDAPPVGSLAQGPSVQPVPSPAPVLDADESAVAMTELGPPPASPLDRALQAVNLAATSHRQAVVGPVAGPGPAARGIGEAGPP